MKELQKNELMTVNGGEVAYLPLTWSDAAADNEILYPIEAVYNGVKAIINVGIWIWNQF